MMLTRRRRRRILCHIRLQVLILSSNTIEIIVSTTKIPNSKI